MKVKRFCSVLALCFCLILSKPFSALADITTDSNALMTMELTDDNYGISTFSSLATVTNTINYDNAFMWIRRRNTETGVVIHDNVSLSGMGYANYIVPDGYEVYTVGLHLMRGAIPSAGTYSYEFDFSADMSVDYTAAHVMSYRDVPNASRIIKSNGLIYTESSGDFYSTNTIQIGAINDLFFYMNFDPLSSGSVVGGYFDLSFVVSDVTDPYYETAGIGMSDTGYQDDVSSSLSDLSFSVDSMTEDLNSAAESLEYISTSQNLIIQGIDNVIVHISDQLYAFWDQLYNLIHEPTYAKLEEILAALRAIANNSDIYAVVEEVRESNQKEMANDTANTDKQIANDNANTDKVTDAVEKHGNFIIDGLKSLFIPSEDYFSSLFDDLNEFFKDRFGFLYTPIDLLVRFIDLIYGSEAEFTGISFPELKWDGYVLLEAQTVNFDILEVEEFKNVQNILYFLTNLAMIGALIALIHKKFEEVMQN